MYEQLLMIFKTSSGRPLTFIKQKFILKFVKYLLNCLLTFRKIRMFEQIVAKSAVSKVAQAFIALG